MPRGAYLPEEDAAVPAEAQRVAVLLPGRVELPQREVHQLPVHVAALGQDQMPAKLDRGKLLRISAGERQMQNNLTQRKKQVDYLKSELH